MEGGGDGADAFGQRADEELARRGEVAGECADAGASLAAVIFSGCTSAIGCTPICSLMMNSIRARPTPAFGIIAVRKARSGFPKFTMIAVRGSFSALADRRVTSNGSSPSNTWPTSPPAQQTVTR